MNESTLFPMDPTQPCNSEVVGTPRVQVPVRNQVEMVCTDLESLIADDHQVRSVWAFVREADLSTLYDGIASRQNTAGRPAIDPRILLALWLWATLRGVGSARHLNDLCVEHVTFRWLCGGVSVNYHTLADFRSENGVVLERVLVQSVARLRAVGLVTLDRVAHDGVRVRASAGGGSFRRKERLDRVLAEAQMQVDGLREELHAEPCGSKRRQSSARRRAAQERLARVKVALDQYPDAFAKKKHDKEKTRVSTTDPEARVMKMADGGFRPAYNVQLSADTDSQIVVSASVIQSGSDHAQLVPAVRTIQALQGATPREVLADGGFAKPEDVEALAQGPNPCVVYAPPTVHKNREGRVLEAKASDTPAVREWRERMGTEAAQKIYRERASTIECVNTLARNRGLQQFRVRGMQRVYATVLLFVLAHNLVRAASLKMERAPQEPRLDTG